MDQPIKTELLTAAAKLDEKDQLAMARMISNEHFKNEVMKCWDIYDRKGNDYTRGKGDLDRLDNFKEAAAGANTTVPQAWYVYAYKHWSAVITYVKKGMVESEPIDGRLHDVINYCILLLLYIRHDEEMLRLEIAKNKAKPDYSNLQSPVNIGAK